MPLIVTTIIISESDFDEWIIFFINSIYASSVKLEKRSMPYSEIKK